MGALIVMGGMFFLLCAGGVLLLLGLVFLWLRREDKRNGTPEKRHKELAERFLILGGVACVLPVLFWLFLYLENSMEGAGYVHTGKMVEHQSEGRFVVEGVTYERLDVARSELCPKGAAVFSWDNRTVMDRLFGYQTRGNYYALENALGLDLVRGGDLWCRADQIEQARAWYADDGNYQWYVQTDDKDSGTYSELSLLAPQPDRERTRDLMDFWEQGKEAVEYVLAEREEVQTFRLLSISTDQVACRDEMWLAVYDGQLCQMGSQDWFDNAWRDTAYPLPAELDGYFCPLLLSQYGQE